ncbi:copper chaperone [Paenibacillus sp. MMS18-CY102]|nr:copper chaperone [Paenibacillus sp. MMS18-CY102]
MKQTKLSVSGMSCDNCVKAVEDALRPLGARGEVSLARGSVDVTYDDSRLTLSRIREAIEEQGFDVTNDSATVS